jgi:hypothetical protein
LCKGARRSQAKAPAGAEDENGSLHGVSNR